MFCDSSNFKALRFYCVLSFLRISSCTPIPMDSVKFLCHPRSSNTRATHCSRSWERGWCTGQTTKPFSKSDILCRSFLDLTSLINLLRNTDQLISWQLSFLFPRKNPSLDVRFGWFEDGLDHLHSGYQCHIIQPHLTSLTFKMKIPLFW